MSISVRIENVSKRYTIGGLHPGYMTFRELVGQALTAPFRRRAAAESGVRTLWALADIDLEIDDGEIVGIIGRNGAGKSTLLKILSRVTKPTRGRVELHGRVGSLLEVGTGFHPDLTGLENIFLNGAILGMRRAEIKRKLDEIIAFSEIERFIGTPVKWYSSGMYVRLAFSVAAHLEPEILIMDEVLAVGDAAFQQKCLDKMNEIRKQGRTIFFVSHNMPAITRLCKRVILLDQGKIISDGQAQKVVNDYLNASWKVGPEREWLEHGEEEKNRTVRLRRVRVRDESGETVAAVDVRHTVGIELTYDVLEGDRFLSPSIELVAEDGTHVFSSFDVSAEARSTRRAAGRYKSTAWIPGNLLSEGNLLVHVAVMSHKPGAELFAREENAAAFQVIDSGLGDSARGDYAGPMGGAVRPLLEWQTTPG